MGHSLPWRCPAASHDCEVAPLALLMFAATRLPSGNLWDALLDPWLWSALHIALLRALYQRWRR